MNFNKLAKVIDSYQKRPVRKSAPTKNPKKIKDWAGSRSYNNGNYEGNEDEFDELYNLITEYEIIDERYLAGGLYIGGNNIETLESLLYSETGLRSLEQLKEDLGIADEPEEEGSDPWDYTVVDECQDQPLDYVEGWLRKNYNVEDVNVDEEPDKDGDILVEFKLDVDGETCYVSGYYKADDPEKIVYSISAC